jgi:hypothetical protein
VAARAQLARQADPQARGPDAVHQAGVEQHDAPAFARALFGQVCDANECALKAWSQNFFAHQLRPPR